MKIHDVHLAGVGTYIPEPTSLGHAVSAGWLTTREAKESGLESVAVEEKISAPDMAIRAAEIAIRRSGFTADDFAALLHSKTFMQGPDGWSAAHYVLLQTLNRPIPAIVVEQGCNGVLTSLEIAAQRLMVEPGKDAILVTTSDNFCTPLVDRWHASSLFMLADSGSSVVVSRRPGFARLLAVRSASDPSQEWRHRGAESFLPPQEPARRLLDFESRVEYWQQRWAEGEAPTGGNFIDLLTGVVGDTLAEAGLRMDDVSRVAHVGFNRPALEAFYLEPLGIDDRRGTWEYTRRVGHASVSDLIIGLERLWMDAAVGVGDKVMMVGTSPGMEVGCAIVEITQCARDAVTIPSPLTRECRGG
jgi:3-oxoacyl-[acyl-carrier-protein] synthase-3